ncbi:transposase [Mycoplasmoides gallisepticum]|nr:transposase [Mycoplasmoides gallisepticum]
MYQNGSYTRNVKWGKEETPIRIKRIRNENQNFQIILKYQRIIQDKFILDVLSLTSTRLSNNEIADQITLMYGFKVSPSVISNCIQTVQEEIRDRRERSLENNYPIIVIDGKVLRLKLKKADVQSM